MRVGIINVTGYAGAELARILARHPEVQLAEVTGRSSAGQPLGAVFPHLDSLGLTIQSDLENVDLAFAALPHHTSAEVIPGLLKDGLRVIDISGDFRLKDPAAYKRWYGIEHPAPELLPEAVYGLPELHEPEIAGARLISNPGCYPTSAILGLAPLVARAERDFIVDSKSGISGAGRTMKLHANHYCEVNESVLAYGLEGHRHQPEIAQELDGVLYRATRERGVDVTFIPHIVPMTRGILSTCYVRMKEDLTQEGLMELYRNFYAGQPFVRVVDAAPQSKHSWGSNFCFIHPRARGNGKVVVVSCIDNLVKGAAGQAVHNMNLMLGFKPDSGLEALPIYP
ncbi:MAG: N-acetyl-gamma-glutamyl-phosphate reductase [Chloroflexota bacterium]|jgi:N-acetyl-gamma-glutamyl-phosphate reductase